MAKKEVVDEGKTPLDGSSGNAGSMGPEICGVIRPIAQTDGYSVNHWSEVGEIINEAITIAGFHPRLVSDADNAAVIHGTIVQNIFDDLIVVCDVSSRNPNVMFELGMRLAFDKPVVIIKDDDTSYSFDTGLIEHVPYPKSLHYHEIRIFKEKLSGKITSTAQKAKEANYSPFLKHFRQISPKKLQNEDVSFEQYIVEKLEAMDGRLNRINLSREDGLGASDGRNKQYRRINFRIPPGATDTVRNIAIMVAPQATITVSGGLITLEGPISDGAVKELTHAIRVLSDNNKSFVETRSGSMNPSDGSSLGAIFSSEQHKLPD